MKLELTRLECAVASLDRSVGTAPLLRAAQVPECEVRAASPFSAAVKYWWRMLWVIGLIGSHPGMAMDLAPGEPVQARAGNLTWADLDGTACPGMDWRLPAWAPARSPFGGFYQLWGDSRLPGIEDVVDIRDCGSWTWAELQPTPTTFRFDLLRQGVNGKPGFDELARLHGRGTGWLVYWRDEAVPEWVRKKWSLKSIPVFDQGDHTEIWPVWQDGPRQALEQFIAAFGREFKHQSALAVLYICALGNPSGELHPSRALVAGLESTGTRIDGAWLEFHLALQRAWVNALGPERCVWIELYAPLQGNHLNDDTDRREREAYRQLIDNALRLGMQSRSGGTDNLGCQWNAADVMNITADGRAGSRHLPLKFYGNEVEQLLAPHYPYTELAVLLGISQGFTHTLLDDAYYELLAGDAVMQKHFDPRFVALLHYLRRVSGYDPAHAPDAWTVLREQPTPMGDLVTRTDSWPKISGVVTRKANVSWLLEQVEAPGAHSVPAMERDWRLTQQQQDEYLQTLKEIAQHCQSSHAARLLRNLPTGLSEFNEGFLHGPFGVFLKPGVTTTFEARRTDLIHGQNALAFRLDPLFTTNLTSRLGAVVTLLDEPGVQWRITYQGPQPSATPMVSCPGSGRLVSFALPLPDLRLRISASDDLRIEVCGKRDATVRMLRLIRMDPPLSDPADLVPAMNQDRDRLQAQRRSTLLAEIVRAEQIRIQDAQNRKQADPQQVALLLGVFARIAVAVTADENRALALLSRQGVNLGQATTLYQQGRYAAIHGDFQSATSIAQQLSRWLELDSKH